MKAEIILEALEGSRPLKVENRWGRIEPLLSPETRSVINSKSYAKHKGRGFECRFVAVNFAKAYPQEKDYRKLADALNVVCGKHKIKGHLGLARGLSCSGMLLSYVIMTPTDARKFDKSLKR